LRPREAGWFDRAKLEAIGFDCGLPVTPEHASRYRVQPPRSTFAALEYEGEVWRGQIDDAANPDALLDTHLAVIDVDNDAAVLRRRHPDRRRVAIVAATAVLQYVANPGQPPFSRGQGHRGLACRDQRVPRVAGSARALSARALSRRVAAALHEPRYRVTVTWGRRLEPWITGVQPLGPSTTR